MPWTPFYSAPLDMTGYRSLLVEAHHPDAPARIPAAVSLRVQGTDDTMKDKKSWVDEGAAIDLRAGSSVSAIFSDTRRLVRVTVEPSADEGADRIKIRVTRLP